MSEELNKRSVFTIDLSYLKDVASGSSEFMIEMIGLFLAQTPSYFEQLHQHIQDENWSGAADIAHKIKPTLAFMGVESARISMAEIEQNARNLVNLNTIPEAFNKLNDLSKELFVKLEEVKKELEQAG